MRCLEQVVSNPSQHYVHHQQQMERESPVPAHIVIHQHQPHPYQQQRQSPALRQVLTSASPVGQQIVIAHQPTAAVVTTSASTGGIVLIAPSPGQGVQQSFRSSIPTPPGATNGNPAPGSYIIVEQQPLVLPPQQKRAESAHSSLFLSPPIDQNVITSSAADLPISTTTMASKKIPSKPPAISQASTTIKSKLKSAVKQQVLPPTEEIDTAPQNSHQLMEASELEALIKTIDPFATVEEEVILLIHFHSNYNYLLHWNKNILNYLC